ncbi:MAG: hypothetical protein GXO47_02435 [Chlorobi bacterium]|nr:hypothetical protein [Chlorobiota bacterium]
MQIQETFRFSAKNYNEEAFDIHSGKFFLELINEFELYFHTCHPTCFANYLFANSATMSLFNKALHLSPNELSGMDLIDGIIDIEANIKMENFSKIKTIYAISSNIKGNEDEPLFLVINEKLADGTIILKYIPDEDGNNKKNTIKHNPVITAIDLL